MNKTDITIRLLENLELDTNITTLRFKRFSNNNNRLSNPVITTRPKRVIHQGYTTRKQFHNLCVRPVLVTNKHIIDLIEDKTYKFSQRLFSTPRPNQDDVMFVGYLYFQDEYEAYRGLFGKDPSEPDVVRYYDIVSTNGSLSNFPYGARLRLAPFLTDYNLPSGSSTHSVFGLGSNQSYNDTELITHAKGLSYYEDNPSLCYVMDCSKVDLVPVTTKLVLIMDGQSGLLDLTNPPNLQDNINKAILRDDVSMSL